jgi:integral membrane protein (TIGR01906 family)
MDSKSAYKTFSTLLLSIIITVGVANIIIIGSLFVVSMDNGFYKSEFNKYNVYGNFNQDKEKIDAEFSDVLDYVKGHDTKLDMSFFNEKEKQHLNDVRDLFSFARYVLIFSLILVLVSSVALYRMDGKAEIMRSALFGASFCIILTIIAAVSSLFDFNSVFIAFHKILFTNDLWLLDFYKDNLIRMLPQQIFADIALRWAVLVSVASSAMVALSIYFIKRKTRE